MFCIHDWDTKCPQLWSLDCHFFHTKHDVMKLVSEHTYVEYRCLMTDCHLITISTISSITLNVQTLLCWCKVNGTKIKPMVTVVCNFNLNNEILWVRKLCVKIDLERHTHSSEWRWILRTAELLHWKSNVMEVTGKEMERR